MNAREQVDAAYETNDRIASAFYAILDEDEEAALEHPDIVVYTSVENPDEIESVEYDGSGVLDWQGSEAVNETQKAFDAWPSEVTIGWGRPLEIMLSGGGPTEWIEARFDSDGDVSEAWLKANYGDYSREWKLRPGCALHRVTEYYAEINQMPKPDEDRW